MKVSIVIVSYNVANFLELCLLSVSKALQKTEGEIIVVDNLSTDNSCSMVKARFPDVVLIENRENVGFSKANNQGVEIAKGEYVLILNPDTVVGEELFVAVLPFADGQKNLGALGVKLIDGTGMFLPESKRGLPTPKASFYKMMGFNKGDYYANYLTKNGIGKIDVLVGAFMLIPKKRYIEVGGFDEDYFMYGEDIDLSYKLTKAGYINYYFGDATVIHYKGESTRKDVKYLNHFYGAMKIFYKKHFKLSLIDFLLARVGINLWFWTKYFKLSNAPIITYNPDKILFIADRRNITENLQLNKTIFKISPSEMIRLGDHITEKNIEEIWFEEKSITYQDIIHQIETHRFKKVLYKILPNSANFLIGSNSSDGRGEVIDLK